MFSIDFPGNEFYIVVEAEDAGDEQEGLGDVHQQAVRDVVNDDDLIRHEGDAADDEQHRTGVLRDFKARVFHSSVFCIGRLWLKIFQNLIQNLRKSILFNLHFDRFLFRFC